MKLKTGLIVALMGFSVACSSDDNNDNNGKTTGTTPATNNTTGGSNNGTATNNVTASTNNATNTNNKTNNTTNGTTSGPVECDNTTFPVGTFYFEGSSDGAGGAITIAKEGNTEDDGSFLSIEFYESAEDAGDAPLNGPGTYEMGSNANDLNYETCLSCLRISTGCGTETCTTQYFASKATVVVTAIDAETGAVSGTISGLEAKEVTIDENTFKSTPVANGETYCLDTVEFIPECLTDAECGDASKPFCSESVCVGCVGLDSCTDAAKPACVTDAAGDSACGVVTECMNDDADEENDGPAAATTIDISALPAVVNAKTCSGTTGQESDWYTFTVAADDTPIRLTLAVADPNAVIDFVIGTDQLQGIGGGPLFGEVLAAGDYFVLVQASDTSAINGGNEATGYTLTLDSGECSTDGECQNGQVCDTGSLSCVECLTDLNCSDAGAPACIANVCGSHDLCTGDDANEPASDGPNSATTITFGTPVDNKICGDLATVGLDEGDWYTFEIAAVSNVRTTLTWVEADPANPVRDIDVNIYDETLTVVSAAAGAPNGRSTAVPEILELSALPAGIYHVRVSQFTSAMMAVAEDYTILTETF